MKTAVFDINGYCEDACGKWLTELQAVINDNDLNASYDVRLNPLNNNVKFVVECENDEDIKPVQQAWARLFNAQYN